MKSFVLAFCLLGCFGAIGQTCTGGLGDPIVNITFGQGASNGPPLAAGITNLAYVDNVCPNDGQYTITNHTSGCFGGTWLTIEQDHTGNQDGYFMLVNASYQPSDFYVQTVNGLCGGTSYQFAAWILNMATFSGQILPNITFRIEKTDGTVLATYSTGDIVHANPAKWNQYAFYFNTPQGISTVVLRMTNNAPGGIGNDLALDDITFRTAGSSVQLSAAGYPSDTITVCDYAQQPMTFSALVESCYPSQQIQWQESTDSGAKWADIAGATTTTLARGITGAGVYLYRLLAAQAGNIGITTCEVASHPMMVDVIRKPAPAVSIAASLPTVCQGLPVTFTATPTDGGTEPAYQWMINGAPAGSDSSGFTVTGLVSGDGVSCMMISDAVCVLNRYATSNTLSLSVVPVPVQSVGITASATAICQDSLVQFVAAPDNGGSDPVYRWQVNGKDAGSGAVFTDGGLENGDTVNCIMTGSLTCSQPVSASPPVVMTVYPLPTVRIDSAVVIAGGSGIRLAPVASADVVRFAWSPAMGLDDATAAEPFATPVSTTAYRVVVTTAAGCRAAAEEVVEVYYPLQMPGAFTPNGDGQNDIFRVPPAFPVTIRYLAVYNRQGTRVFYTTNAAAGWDGRFGGAAQPAGVYVWALGFNNPLTKKVEERRGTVVLVR